MTYTYSSVACNEVPDSAWENGDVFSGLSAGVRLQCAYSNRFALINDLLGTPCYYPKTHGLGGMDAWAVSARCVSIGGETYTQNGQGCDFADAYVDVNYNTTIVDLASEVIEPNMEMIPLNYGSFCWGSVIGNQVGLAEQEAPPLVLQSFNLVRTRFRLASLPVDVLNAVGCVNMYSYTSSILGFTFPAETLLYMPSPTSRSFTNFTGTGFTATIAFSYRPNGWNKQWRGFNQAWEFQYIPGTTTVYRPFALYDMTTLLS